MAADADRAVDKATLSSLREQLGGEDPVLDRILGLYLRELPGRMAAIRSAVEQGDAEALRESAHALRGSSVTLGATLAAELSAGLEAGAVAGDLARAPELLQQLEEAARLTAAVFESEIDGGAER
jgi:HPt (histidine-containing phosphotransfer) domain-containing protein